MSTKEQNNESTFLSALFLGSVLCFITFFHSQNPSSVHQGGQNTGHVPETKDLQAQWKHSVLEDHRERQNEPQQTVYEPSSTEVSHIGPDGRLQFSVVDEPSEQAPAGNHTPVR